MKKSEVNLIAAFAGESQANRKYLAFSKKAEEEGFTQVAKLFKATAEAETVHALNHLRTLGDVKSTLENLNSALAGEAFEYEKMYPEYIEAAKQEGNKQATWTFDVANKVEQVHGKLYRKAIDALQNKKELEKVDYYVCSVCGHTVEGAPPDKCPICASPKSVFFKPA